MALPDPEASAAAVNLVRAAAFVSQRGWGSSHLAYAVDHGDPFFQAVLAAIVLFFFLTQLRPLTLATLDPELARARGLHPALLHYGFSLLVAATVAVGLKMLGALLLSALIVTPAAAARLASTGFRGLILGALLLGIAAPPVGITASAAFNLPTGPCIVLVHVAALAICQFIHLIRPLKGITA
jgi:zinc transport system permease protein